jgi:hypothetical protein
MANSHGDEELSIDLISLSRAEMEFSRAEMELSKSEMSVGRIESKWAKITVALLLVPMVCCLSLVILAFREDYVYKKSLKRQHNA